MNALLAAWLVRNVTGQPWPRATEPLPPWPDRQFMQARVRLGGQSEMQAFN